MDDVKALLKKKKRTCKALTKSGNPCRLSPLKGEEYCNTHKKDKKQ